MPVACVGCSCPCKCPRGGKVPRGGGRQQSFPNQLRGLKQQLGEWWNRLVKGQTPGAKESREEWEEAELRLQRTSREESSRNREFLRSAWQHGGARGACTRSCTKRQKPAGRDGGNGERCFPNSTAGTPSCPRSRRAVPFGAQQPALQSTAAMPGNFPVRHISSPRSVSGSPPGFRCIFLLSYLASCRQQAPGQRHGRPYHPPCKPASQAPQLSGPGSAGR